MKAPTFDCFGKKIICELCSLHLIGFSDSLGTSIHSDPDNKGLILALGNIGKYLNNDNINTYLSNDGVTFHFKFNLYRVWLGLS